MCRCRRGMRCSRLDCESRYAANASCTDKLKHVPPRHLSVTGVVKIFGCQRSIGRRPLRGRPPTNCSIQTSLRPDGGFYSAVRPPGESGGIYMTAAGSFSRNGTYWFRPSPLVAMPRDVRLPRKHVQISMAALWSPALRLALELDVQHSAPANCTRACASSNRFENVFRRRQPFRTRAAIPSCTDGIPEVQFHRTTTLPGREETVRNRLVKGRLPD